MKPVVHIVGAGMAGLAAAVRLVGLGARIAVHEATDHAGGRCRSYVDPAVGALIDNGNHLLMGANTATFDYLEAIGAADALAASRHAVFPFIDLATGQRWTVRPSRGPLPLWIFDPARRIPGTRARDYLEILKVMFAGHDATVADAVGTSSPLFERFWRPFTEAVLNTSPEDGSARLIATVLRLTFAKGEAHCRPYMARRGLSPDLVDPALSLLARNGCAPTFNQRIRSLSFDNAGKRVTRLSVANGADIDLGRGDCVIVAVPAPVAADLIPGLDAPREASPIVNAHFRLDVPASIPEDAPLLGVIGGLSQWIFVRDRIASVTISAAASIVDMRAEDLAARLWPEIRRALALPESPVPPCRIVKEKRATFAQTPAALRRRPGTVTGFENLFLAGDWTDTGLPATIEGAVRSGHRAAAFAVR